MLNLFRWIRSIFWIIFSRNINYYSNDHSLMGNCVNDILFFKGGFRALKFIKEVNNVKTPVFECRYYFIETLASKYMGNFKETRFKIDRERYKIK